MILSLMGLKSESVFVIAAMMGLAAAIYLALLAPYITDWHAKMLTLLLALCLLLSGIIFSICYLFHGVIFRKLTKTEK